MERQDFLNSITRIEFNEEKGYSVEDTCLPKRHNDTTERTAKIRATKRAHGFGLIPVDTQWKQHSDSQVSVKTYKDPHSGDSRYVIVQRVNRLTR